MSTKRNFDELVASLNEAELEELEAAIRKVKRVTKKAKIWVPCWLETENIYDKSKWDEKSTVIRGYWPEMPKCLFWLKQEVLKSARLGDHYRTKNWELLRNLGPDRAEGRVKVRIDYTPFSPTTEGGMGYDIESKEVLIFFQHEGRFYPFKTPLPVTTTWQKIKAEWIRRKTGGRPCCLKFIEGCESIDKEEGGWSSDELFPGFIPIPV
jgi:hypothetical protein